MAASFAEIVSIAESDPSDVAVMFEIYRDVVASGGATPSDDDELHNLFDEGWIRRRRVYAAHQQGTTVGGYFLRSNFPAMAGHIAQCGYLVSRDVRGQGIGTKLVRHSLAEARRLGYSAMMFNLVNEDNPSRRIYERVGFHVIGRIPRAHGGHDGLIYWRDLATDDTGTPSTRLLGTAARGLHCERPLLRRRIWCVASGYSTQRGHSHSRHAHTPPPTADLGSEAKRSLS